MLYTAGEYTYEPVGGWAKLPKEWSFLDVCGLAIDSQDRVYIVNRGTHPIMVFDRDGNLINSWGEGFFKRAHGCCVGIDGSVYCTDDGHHTVSKFTPEGKLALQLGKKDHPSDTGFVHTSGLPMTSCLHTIKRGGMPFNRPTGVALSSSGEIYVSDGYGNARVHKFSSDGTLLLSWGEPGYDEGRFRLPHSIWVDKQENVWVTDRENSRLQIFNTQGEFLDEWTDFSRPTDISIDDSGIVYVSELCLRLSIFNKDGKLLARWGNQGQEGESELFLAPHTIAVDSLGDIYVGEVSWTYNKVDRGLETVHKFRRVA